MGLLGAPVFSQVEVEIRAAPDTVRSVFLDFPRYKDWTHTSHWTVDPADTGKKAADLLPGDRLRVDLGGMSFRPTVVENTQDSFTWDGSIGGLLVGRHKFAFLPSVSNPGGTTLLQREDWLGPLSVPFRLGPKRWSHGEGWTRFNEDIKKEAERRAGSGAHWEQI